MIRLRPRGALGLGLGLVLGVGTVVGAATLVGPAGDDALVGARPSVVPRVVPLSPSTTAVSFATEAAARHAAAFVRTADGVVLPDRTITPGAAFTDVTAGEICDLHYTQGVRQPRFNVKVSAFANYGISIHDRDVYRVDHLVPVSLGGTNDEANLWPQPYDATAGADQKDLLEHQLRGLVCSGSLELADAQAAIAGDWWQTYGAYMGLPIEPGSAGPAPWRPATPAPGEVVNGGACATEGEVGYTDPKRIRLTCGRTGSGELRWQKRN